MTYRAVASPYATDWTETWLVVDEKYNVISKHGGRKTAEMAAETLNNKEDE